MGLIRHLYKTPIFFYRHGFGSHLGRRILLLTTIGRKSKQKQVTPLSYVELDGVFYVFSGWGPESDWYKNLLKDPHVEIEVGSRRFSGVATLLKTIEVPGLREAYDRMLPFLVEIYIRWRWGWETLDELVETQRAFVIRPE